MAFMFFQLADGTNESFLLTLLIDANSGKWLGIMAIYLTKLIREMPDLAVGLH